MVSLAFTSGGIKLILTIFLLARDHSSNVQTQTGKCILDIHMLAQDQKLGVNSFAMHAHSVVGIQSEI